MSMHTLPPESPDPAVRRLASRRAALLQEALRLRYALDVYAANMRNTVPRAPVSPMKHYSMLDSSDCGCVICADWETRRAEFVDAVSLVPKGHKWSTCSCQDCRFVGRVQLNYLAATNKRDLTIEMSFHARYHSRQDTAVMSWLDQELRRPEYTLNWCAQEMSRYPMERWIRKCEAALSPLVSGRVFIEAAGVIPMLTRIGSSLDFNMELAVTPA